MQTQRPHYIILVEPTALDIEDLRTMAYKASWTSPRQQTGHWDEKWNDGIAFCFEGHLAALRFDRDCDRNGVKHYRQWPANS
jgi:hypothetical protein